MTGALRNWELASPVSGTPATPWVRSAESGGALIGRVTPRAHEIAIVISAKAASRASTAQKDSCGSCDAVKLAKARSAHCSGASR